MTVADSWRSTLEFAPIGDRSHLSDPELLDQRLNLLHSADQYRFNLDRPPLTFEGFALHVYLCPNKELILRVSRIITITEARNAKWVGQIL